LAKRLAEDLTAATATLKGIEGKIADANRQIKLLTAKDIDGTTEKGKRDLAKLEKFDVELASYSLQVVSAQGKVAGYEAARKTVASALA
jgi:hypothetical protein